LYEKLGQYRDAVPVLQRAIAIREQSLGREHPDTATSLNNLAMVYKKLAMFTEAAELAQRALAICEKVLGSEHPETVIVRSNYADLVQEHAPAAPE
jgi:tetratricopeptide (TPR) repeat protein